MKLLELRQKRAEIVEQMRELTDQANGDLTDEQEKRFESLKSELLTTEKAVQNAEFLEDAERRMQGQSLQGKDSFESQVRNFSLQKLLQRSLGAKVDSGLEEEISQELGKREQRSTEGFLVPREAFQEKRTVGTMTTDAPVTGPGGNLIGTDFLSAQYIDILREADPLAALGVRHLSGLHGNVEIPKAMSGTSVSWTAENAALSQTEMAFSSITMQPKHLGAWAEFSRNLILQSSPDAEALLKADLAQAMALALAKAVLNGSGQDNEPTGILHTTGINSVTTPAEVMDYVPELSAALLEHIYQGNMANVAFCANSTLKKAVDELLTTDKLPVGETAFFRGNKHIWTSLLPAATTMLAGDFSQVLVGHWGSLELLVNPYMESAYKKGNVAIRVIESVDVAIRYPEAFATFTA